ncbi:hypothetical protein [Streptomyces sp. NPDC048361]|uniref:SCO4402 family protein n=1 Tax=Streptomyces sp. NPDC048361 TaxID=3154720 RepID=UPI00343FEE98
MVDHGIALPVYRLHVVQAVLSLATPSWQREVWLRRAEFESLTYVVTALFDDFCDAEDPAPWLGRSLRTEEEVALMRQLGQAYGAVESAVGRDASDEEYLASPAWEPVITLAARLAHVMVTNDLTAAVRASEAPA